MISPSTSGSATVSDSAMELIVPKAGPPVPVWTQHQDHERAHHRGRRSRERSREIAERAPRGATPVPLGIEHHPAELVPAPGVPEPPHRASQAGAATNSCVVPALEVGV